MPPTTPPPATPPPITTPSDGQELLEPGEQVVTVVHRSIIGLIGFYIEILVGIAAILALIVVLQPKSLKNLSPTDNVVLMVIAVLATALVILILVIVTVVYRQSELLITDRSVIQVVQKGLFIRNVSRLSMANVEDVTGQTKGFLATIFGYGTLIIQTAGEMENFVFKFCPDPNRFAHEILEARQLYARSIQENPNEPNP